MSKNQFDRQYFERALAGVEGWLAPDDAVWLARHAAQVVERDPHAVVVEIGSWKGRSTIAMGVALRQAGCGRIFAIDPHRGDPEHPSDTMPEFLRNLHAAGIAQVVEPIRAFSREPIDRFADGSVQFMFLDGSHEYEEVSRDIAEWGSKLADGAEVAFDDADWPGVNRALRAQVAQRGSQFRRPRYLGKILYCQVARDRRWTLGDSIAAVRLQIFLRALLMGRPLAPRLHWRFLPATRAVLRALLNAPLRDLPTRLAVLLIDPLRQTLDTLT